MRKNIKLIEFMAIIGYALHPTGIHKINAKNVMSLINHNLWVH